MTKLFYDSSEIILKNFTGILEIFPDSIDCKRNINNEIYKKI